MYAEQAAMQKHAANFFLDGNFRQSLASSQFNGGAGRDRTDDLLNANQALSQLSYGPEQHFLAIERYSHCAASMGRRRAGGPG